MKKVTVPQILGMKRAGEPVVCLTAYDFTSGLIADKAGVDLILIGDSLGTVIQGHTSTTQVTLEQVAYHVACVRPAVERAHLSADLPLGSYGGSIEQAVSSAVRLVQAGAESVKLEGTFCDEVRSITKVGIPVMGHLGMTPQSVNAFGGHRVQGKGGQVTRLVDDAKALEAAGVFAIVLELVEAQAAEAVSKAVGVPTIGIGAGAGCDGQIQVFHDVLGLWSREFRHAKRYTQGARTFVRALKKYTSEVRNRQFPDEGHSF